MGRHEGKKTEKQRHLLFLTFHVAPCNVPQSALILYNYFAYPHVLYTLFEYNIDQYSITAIEIC